MGWYSDYRSRNALSRRAFLYLLCFAVYYVFIAWCASQFGLIGGIVGAFVGSYGSFLVLLIVAAIRRRRTGPK